MPSVAGSSSGASTFVLCCVDVVIHKFTSLLSDRTVLTAEIAHAVVACVEHYGQYSQPVRNNIKHLEAGPAA